VELLDQVVVELVVIDQMVEQVQMVQLTLVVVLEVQEKVLDLEHREMVAQE
jgi:hypothetical protein